MRTPAPALPEDPRRGPATAENVCEAYSTAAAENPRAQASLKLLSADPGDTVYRFGIWPAKRTSRPKLPYILVLVSSWTDPNIETQVALVVITLVYTVTTILIWRATSQNTKATSDILQAAYRPYIAFPSIEVKTPEITTGTVQIAIGAKNVGLVPARRISLSIELSEARISSSAERPLHAALADMQSPDFLTAFAFLARPDGDLKRALRSVGPDVN